MTLKKLISLAAILFTFLASNSLGWAQGIPSSLQELKIAASKDAVVRIEAGAMATFRFSGMDWPIAVGYSATGAIVHPSGYIVTNAHVVSAVQHSQKELQEMLSQRFLEEVSKETGRRSFGDEEIKSIAAKTTLSSPVEVIQRVVLPGGKAYKFEVKTMGGSALEGKHDVAVIKIDAANLPTVQLGSKDAQVKDKIKIVGVPGSSDPKIFFHRENWMAASINSGVLSTEKTMPGGAKVFEIEAPMAPAFSGAPVFLDDGTMTGLATFGSGIGQGFNFLLPAKTVAEYLKIAGVTNSQGELDKKVQSALELYQKGQLSKASPALQEILKLNENHQLAQILLADVSEKLAAEPQDSSIGSAFLSFLAYSLALILIITLIYLAYIKREQILAMFTSKVQAEKNETETKLEAVMESNYEAEQETMLQAAAATEFDIHNKQIASSEFNIAISEDNKAMEWLTQTKEYGKITFLSGPLTGESYSIPLKGILIGRNTMSCDIVLQEPTISKEHLWIGPESLSSSNIMAKDKDSTNGSFMGSANGKAIIGSVVLEADDIIYLGQHISVQYRK